MEEFFIACNRDSDLYIGVQQGDNGQSVMLGGVTREGKPAFNDLSRLCLKACGELKLVDPKINLRVDKSTPLGIYELGTELTAKGLGFPQYANDDVVIPALQRWGYELEDARDYSVAACWEFLVPGCGMDINNIDAVSFVGALDRALRVLTQRRRGAELLFDDVKREFFGEVQRRADALVKKYAHVEILPGPFVSVISTDCIKKARDISKGAKYNNFGIHGTGIAVAVDSLASVRELVFEKKLVALEELVKLLDTDFAGRPDVLAAAKAAPKMGNADARADDLAKELVAFWGHAFDGKRNDRGGIFRPGTGSAMYYIWHARDVPASADGAFPGRAGERPGERGQVLHRARPWPGVQRRAAHYRDTRLRVCNAGWSGESRQPREVLHRARRAPDADQHDKPRHASRRTGASRAPSPSHRPRLGLERILHRTG